MGAGPSVAPGGMTMRYERSILGGSLGLFVLACGGTTSTGPGVGSTAGGGGSTTPGTAAAFIADYCSLLVPCCADAGLGNGQTCQVLLGALVSQETYNAQAAPACLKSMQQASTQADFCTTGASAPSCDGVFASGSGIKGPGQPCSQD